MVFILKLPLGVDKAWDMTGTNISLGGILYVPTITVHEGMLVSYLTNLSRIVANISETSLLFSK